MFEVQDPRQSPYSSICYIRCDWPDGSATRASAVVVGLNDVLTALHAVFDQTRGGWADYVTVFPAADTSPFFSAPFGGFSQVGSYSGRAANWDMNGDGLLTPEESAGDLALLGMTERIGDVTGWLPVSNLPSDFSGVMAGYPARGSGMMVESAFVDASSWWGVYDVNTGLGSGASGGPLLYSAGGVTSVVGVLSSGTADNTASTYAGLFGAGTWDWLQSAIDANDTLLGLPPGSAPDSSPNIYVGTSGADVTMGTAGRDVFTGLGGNDVYDGSFGLDTAAFTGTYASHTVTVVSYNEIRVVDQAAWRDGSDAMWNIERLRFDDYTVAFDIQGNAGQAYRLYRAAFDRLPDLPGLGYQTNALDTGLTLSQVAANFLASPEFTRLYGSNVANDVFVTQLYRNVLDREPESAGLAYHMERLQAGTSRAEVLLGFSESPENQANVIGAIQGGIVFIAV